MKSLLEKREDRYNKLLNDALMQLTLTLSTYPTADDLRLVVNMVEQFGRNFLEDTYSGNDIEELYGRVNTITQKLVDYGDVKLAKQQLDKLYEDAGIKYEANIQW